MTTRPLFARSPFARPLTALTTSALALAAALAGSAAMADSFDADSAVTEAVLYPQGATLTREAAFELPAGRHTLVLTDMPLIELDSLRLAAEGLTIGTLSYRDRQVPPSGAEEPAEIAAARDRIEEIEDRIQAVEDRARAAELEAEASRDRITFLTGLGGSDAAGGADRDRLQMLLELVGEEGLAARRAAREADLRAREIREEKTPLEEDLAEAEAALDALLTASEDESVLAVEVTAEAPVSGVLTLHYTSWEASWYPAYDLHLQTGEAPALQVRRGAYLSQATGEDWSDVAVTLSTARPSGRIAPSGISGQLLRIVDLEAPQPKAPELFSRAAGADMAMAPMAEPVMEEAQAGFDGINVTYAAPQPVSLANGADAAKIELGRLEMTPEVFARAVPLYDPSAYLVAQLTNDSGEMLLPGPAQLFRDGTYVGRTHLDMLPVDEEVEWAFGPIDGLRVTRRLDDRMEGDRGVIRRANDRREAVTITAENRTDQAWDLRLLDRVPYSEQEDLDIAWEATPMPDVQDFDDRRGVLEWQFELAPGAEQEIALSHEVTWPEDMVLR
ncbi:DUF4139 domain-containing protein [Ferrimonas balearica]|nr:DUF4139 domain-containing protein [Ferrimonas balearica]